MEGRHLHFGVLMLLFFYIAIKVVDVPVKYLTAKYYVPGVTEIVHN